MHFGLGLAAGAASGLPFLRAALKEEASRNSRIWLMISYLLGAVAVFPSFLGVLGVPETITSGWYMNIFLLHPIMDQLKSGGKLIGETLIVSCFLFQYLMMLMLLLRTKRRQLKNQ
jgi:hypothetical protein